MAADALLLFLSLSVSLGRSVIDPRIGRSRQRAAARHCSQQFPSPSSLATQIASGLGRAAARLVLIPFFSRQANATQIASGFGRAAARLFHSLNSRGFQLKGKKDYRET